jgi:hypothetical protein
MEGCRDRPWRRGRTIGDIEALWRYARQLGCDYIRLDADAGVDPRLPTYEWR